jgi:hypothetical protein
MWIYWSGCRYDIVRTSTLSFSTTLTGNSTRPFSLPLPSKLSFPATLLLCAASSAANCSSLTRPLETGMGQKCSNPSRASLPAESATGYCTCQCLHPCLFQDLSIVRDNMTKSKQIRVNKWMQNSSSSNSNPEELLTSASLKIFLTHVWHIENG